MQVGVAILCAIAAAIMCLHARRAPIVDWLPEWMPSRSLYPAWMVLPLVFVDANPWMVGAVVLVAFLGLLDGHTAGWGSYLTFRRVKGNPFWFRPEDGSERVDNEGMRGVVAWTARLFGAKDGSVTYQICGMTLRGLRITLVAGLALTALVGPSGLVLAFAGLLWPFYVLANDLIGDRYIGGVRITIQESLSAVSWPLAMLIILHT